MNRGTLLALAGLAMLLVIAVLFGREFVKADRCLMEAS
jgi:hypothetical protein